MKIKRIFLLLICIFMISQSNLVFADSSQSIHSSVMLGSSGIMDKGTNVYYGSYKQSSDGQGGFVVEPIKWNVLSGDSLNNEILVISDKIIDMDKFHVDNEVVTWEKSTIRSWLNGYSKSNNTGETNGIDYSQNNFIKTAFSTDECNVIKNKSISNPQHSGSSFWNNTTDKVFFLSSKEASNFYDDDNSRRAITTAYAASKDSVFGTETYNYWVLRTPISGTGGLKYVLNVGITGAIYNTGFRCTENIGIRPAFTFDSKKILLCSDVSNGKPVKVGNVSKVSEVTSDEYKLTVLDANRGFKLTDTTARTVVQGDKLVLNYTDAVTGDSEYVSAIISDSANNILYYGQLVQSKDSNGIVNFEIPSDIKAGEYTLSLFNEQLNGGMETDFSSSFSNISLCVLGEPSVKVDQTKLTVNNYMYGDVIVASYKTNGTKLLNCVIIKSLGIGNSVKTYSEIGLDTEGADAVYAFMWNNTDDMVPLCNHDFTEIE